MAIIGGCYAIDDNVKIDGESKNNSRNLLTWGEISIDKLKKDNIQRIELIATAGDVVQFEVTFYVEKDGKLDFYTENYYVKKFSIETISRMTAVGFEEKRKEYLGLD